MDEPLSGLKERLYGCDSKEVRMSESFFLISLGLPLAFCLIFTPALCSLSRTRSTMSSTMLSTRDFASRRMSAWRRPSCRATNPSKPATCKCNRPSVRLPCQVSSDLTFNSSHFFDSTTVRAPSSTVASRRTAKLTSARAERKIRLPKILFRGG